MERTWIIGALLLGACVDNGSLGNYDTGSGDGSGGSSSQTETGAPETSATTASTVSATTDSASTTSVSDSDTDFNTTGEPLMCEGGNGCPLTIDCEAQSCGQVPSIFDTNGCVRPTCHDEDACGDMERCFIALDFGLCEASGTDCADNFEGPDPSCDCGGTADCNGGHCVPALDFPPGNVESLPTRASFELQCGPDDGIIVVVHVYDEGPLDGCTPPDGASEVLTVSFTEASPEVGDYEMLAATGTGTGTIAFAGDHSEVIQRARMSITAIDDEHAELTLDIDTFYEGVSLASSHVEIGRANRCAMAGPCG